MRLQLQSLEFTVVSGCQNHITGFLIIMRMCKPETSHVTTQV